MYAVIHNFEDVSKELVIYGANPFLADEVISFIDI